MKYSIIIPTYNHCDDLLKPCIESILKTTDLSDKEVIIIANGCTDNTLNYLSTLPQPFKYLFFPNPIGYAKAINEGLHIASGEYMILLNNDVEFTSQETDSWINILRAPFIDPAVAVSGPLLNAKTIADYQFLVFFCVMIPRRIFFELGLLDENCVIGGGEDADFCIRAQKAGYLIYEVCPGPRFEPMFAVGGFPVFHKSGKTVSGVENWQHIFDTNMKMVEKKYASQINSKVAVIMPYRITSKEQARLFENACMSILSQTHENLILFLMDNGTPDEFLPSKAGDIRVKYFSARAGMSAAYARNAGLDELGTEKFDYIAFCDSDDRWYPTHLEDSLDYLQNSTSDAICSTPEFVDPSGNKMIPFGIPIDNKPTYENIRQQNSIYISSVVVARECVDPSGLMGILRFDENLDGIEDWDFWLSMLERGWYFCKKPGVSVLYTVREGSNASAVTKDKMNIFREKHGLATGKNIRLNLGCGDEYLINYINCDMYAEKADMHFDAKTLPFEDNSVDEIRAYHLIEHFKFKEAFEVLKEWKRVLKSGGKLVMETPDLLNTCKKFVELPGPEKVILYGHFFAWPDLSPGQIHYFLYTEEQMMWTLGECGFIGMERQAPDSTYARSNPQWPELYLKVVAYKP